MSVYGASCIKISALGQYEGYSSPIYNGNRRYSVYVTMKDGTKLAVDYYIPTKDDVEETKPLPVLFHYTPYDRVVYGRVASKMFPLRKTPDPEKLYFLDWGMEGFMDLGRYGYVIAIADVRGTGASFGCRPTTNSRQEAQDGKELVEWLLRQPFCDGKLGTAGYSYTGQSQLECLSTGLQGVAASFICMTDFDKYDGWIRGGVPRAFGTKPDISYGETEEQIEQTICRIAADTVPVDDDPDRCCLKQAIREHMQSGNQVAILRDLNWRDSYLAESGGAHWQVIGMSAYVDQINATGAAVYLIGGVYDVFRKETVAMYHNLNLPKKLLIGPWYHMDPKSDVRWDVEMLRWFDYWLKGIDNGIMEDAPITYRQASYRFEKHAVVGSGTGCYVERDRFPAAPLPRRCYYLSGDQPVSGSAVDDHALLSGCAPEKKTLYYSDPYGCVTSIETPLTTHPSGKGLDQIGMTFTSAPLSAPVKLLGTSVAKVLFSLEDPGYMKNNYDLDFFVSVSDYEPERDEAFLITSGQLRASLRAEAEAPYDTGGTPWHRCNVGDNEYLELGKKYELLIDLLPTSYTVPEGHCIRVTISNSMDRMYYLGRQAYEADPDCAKPGIHIYTGGENASCVELGLSDI